MADAFQEDAFQPNSGFQVDREMTIASALTNLHTIASAFSNLHTIASTLSNNHAITSTLQ